MANDTLIRKLALVLRRAEQGDQQAVNICRQLRAKALAGDPDAKQKHNTLAVLHWQNREGQAKYAEAEAFYHRLLRKDPDARQRLQVLVSRVREGRPESLRTFRVLKSIHHKYKASAWSGPGAPRVGGYGLPAVHRAGIDIPSTSYQQVRPMLTPQAINQLLAMTQAALSSLPPWLQPQGYTSPLAALGIPNLPGLPALPGIPQVQGGLPPMLGQAFANLAAQYVPGGFTPYMPPGGYPLPGMDRMSMPMMDEAPEIGPGPQMVAPTRMNTGPMNQPTTQVTTAQTTALQKAITPMNKVISPTSTILSKLRLAPVMTQLR